MSIQRQSKLFDPTNANVMTRRGFLEAAVGTVATGSLAALAACGQSPSGTTSSNQKMTIEFWVWDAAEKWKEVEQKSGLAKQFPNVTFKWTVLPADQLHQKALTALGAGLPQGLPSIIRTSAGYYHAFAATGNLTDVTQEITPYQKDILPSVWGGIQVNNKIYEVPDDTGVIVFGYRKDLFQKAGLPTDPDEVANTLKTYDDLISAGRTLQQKIGAKLFSELPGDVFITLMLQDSTGYFDKDGNVIFDSDYHVEVANISRKIWNSGFTAHYEQGPQMLQAYKSDQLATMFYPNWQDFVIIDQLPQTKGKWKVTQLPAVIPGGKRATTPTAVPVGMVIPAALPDDQKKLAVKVATHLRLTKEGTVAHMQTFFGTFVSYQPGLEAMSSVVSPVLDNQYPYQIYLNAARDLPPCYHTSNFFADADTAARNALFKILKENAPVKPTLKSAADSIRKLQDSKKVK